jgi:hypothetical protein
MKLLARFFRRPDVRPKVLVQKGRLDTKGQIVSLLWGLVVLIILKATTRGAFRRFSSSVFFWEWGQLVTVGLFDGPVSLGRAVLGLV